MPKSKSKSGEEFYKGKVRELQKKNRTLEKRIRQLEKTSHFFDEIMFEPEPEDIKPIIIKCTNCGKGNLSTFELVGRIFEECNVCDYRKKIR